MTWRILIFLVFFCTTGCGSELTNYLPGRDEPAETQLQTRLDKGNRLFMAGDYSAAAEVFENLRETGDQNVARPALYGLACSRFMLADTRQEYLEAVEILEHWQRTSPTCLEQEDPRMLIALFSEAFPGASKGEADASRASEGQFLMRVIDYGDRVDELEAQITTLENEMAAYENQKEIIKEMESANQAMKQTLKEKEDATRTMAEELSKLRDQIKTLETIDQEIQEKKQGISSP